MCIIRQKIKNIRLYNFRSHKNYFLSLDDDKYIFLLSGPNGVGKTSILESISLFYPGKGIRSSPLVEIVTKISTDKEWSVIFDIESNSDILQAKIIFDGTKKVFIDQTKATKASKVLGLLWLSPQICQKVVLSQSSRRKFFDKMVYFFYEEHARNFLNFNNLVKERNKLLENYNCDRWLSNIESMMNEYSLKISELREKTINKINANNNKCKISLEEKYKEDYQKQLRENRQIDKICKMTTIGPHRSRVLIHKDTLSIDQCSMGEQMGVFISILISQIEIQKAFFKKTSVLLLDDTLSYLDDKNKRTFLELLNKIECQTLITTANDFNFDKKIICEKKLHKE